MRSADNATPMKSSNLDKVFWPEEKYTKQNLAEFYRDVFPLLKPYVDDRVLTLERCPDGMNHCSNEEDVRRG